MHWIVCLTLLNIKTILYLSIGRGGAGWSPWENVIYKTFILPLVNMLQGQYPTSVSVSILYFTIKHSIYRNFVKFNTWMGARYPHWNCWTQWNFFLLQIFFTQNSVTGTHIVCQWSTSNDNFKMRKWRNVKFLWEFKMFPLLQQVTQN